MLMSNENILYELFWHLIFAKNMLSETKEESKKIVTTRILSACFEGNISRKKKIQTYSNVMLVWYNSFF